MSPWRCAHGGIHRGRFDKSCFHLPDEEALFSALPASESRKRATGACLDEAAEEQVVLVLGIRSTLRVLDRPLGLELDGALTIRSALHDSLHILLGDSALHPVLGVHQVLLDG